ncbi:MAG: hypothetical protein M3276_09965, partial [Actinomycetota bacterium]|nr:hypothetical protein [Actinomycetota bacterium]
MDVSLDQAETLVAACRGVVAAATRRLAADSAREGRVDLGLLDREQVLAYDLSTVASKVAAAEEMVVYGRAGDFERLLAV